MDSKDWCHLALEIEHWLSGKEDKELIQALKELSKWSDKKIFHDAKHAGHGKYGRIVGSNQKECGCST